MPPPISPPPRRNPFSAATLDRLAEHRRDPAWLTARFADPSSRFAPVWRLRNLFTSAETPRARFLSRGELDEALGGALPGGTEPILLGGREDGVYFAVGLPDDLDVARFPGEFLELRRAGPLLDPEDAALLAQARGMVYWHARHRFCGECGGPAVSREAGHLRACDAAACGARHFPRTDPAIIVLVSARERCLLGRQAAWTEGQYATLAGFVEPGESLEDAVAREVREETGVEVSDIRYHSSQPWPFPASLMVGFTATARTEEIRVDPTELEDARWFTRSELREGVRSGRLRLPTEISIAHALIRDWLQADPDQG